MIWDEGLDLAVQLKSTRCGISFLSNDVDSYPHMTPTRTPFSIVLADWYGINLSRSLSEDTNHAPERIEIR